MNLATLEGYLLVGAVLFALGIVGFLTRRNMIILFLSAEMMLQGVAINLVAFAKYRGDLGGQVLVLFILAVAACEAALALAFILMLYRRKKSLDISLWQEMREPDQEPIVDEDPVVQPPQPEEILHLPPAGPAPPAKEDVTEVTRA